MNNEPLNLETLVNKEKLLHLALHVVNSGPDQELMNIAQDIVIWYVIRDFEKEGGLLTEIDFEKTLDKVNKILFNSVFDSLAKKGILEEEMSTDDEPTYKITEFGKMVQKKINKR